ncbi:hypothetical protein PMAYCL1PPCAC_08992, partial [Pristionchus mayeri]
FQGETFHNAVVCSRIRYGSTFVYRIFDDPDSDGIHINVPRDELNGLSLKGIHRGKAIYLSNSTSKSHSSVRKLGDNAIVIEASTHENAGICATDSYPLVYLLHFNRNLHVLDTRTMQFLPILQLGDIIDIRYIAGIHNGEITVKGRMGRIGERYLV